MKILFVGDTHGQIDLINFAIEYGKSCNVERIIQVGDFGFFPNLYPSFLDSLKSPIPFYFIDGNHDDHSILSLYRHENSPINLEDIGYNSYNFFYIPRGYIERLGSLQVLFIGGANSIDYKGRVEYIDWWANEGIDQEDFYRCIGNSSYTDIDVIVSHEGITNEIINFKEKSSSRIAIEQLVKTIKPKLLIHGHHHISYTSVKNKDLTIKGLGCTKVDMLELLIF